MQLDQKFLNFSKTLIKGISTARDIHVKESSKSWLVKHFSVTLTTRKPSSRIIPIGIRVFLEFSSNRVLVDLNEAIHRQ